MMTLLTIFLVMLLVLTAFAVERTKDLLSAVIVFAAFSLILSVLMVDFKSPRCGAHRSGRRCRHYHRGLACGLGEDREV